jgi:hypothetical protein
LFWLGAVVTENPSIRKNLEECPGTAMDVQVIAREHGAIVLEKEVIETLQKKSKQRIRTKLQAQNRRQ